MESFLRTQMRVTFVLLLKKFHNLFLFHVIDMLLVLGFVVVIYATLAVSSLNSILRIDSSSNISILVLPCSPSSWLLLSPGAVD